MTPGQIQNILKNLPQQSGVYRFYGMADNLLYIGKAKNLKNRVSSYFQISRHEDNIRLQNMVSQIERVDYTVVKNEKESLILEANLIHNLQPKYNIQLKDDKSYLYVRISNQGSWPNITLTRRRYDSKSQYFGPYTKKYGISNLLRVLRIIFPYCDKCAIDGKPCNYVQLKQCDGICCNQESLNDYKTKINQISKVLSGQTKEVESWLNQKMRDAININNFELAGLWRDRVRLLDEVINDQKIILPHEQDLDIVTIVIKIDSKNDSKVDSTSNLTVAAAFVQNIRAGKMINLSNFILSGQDYFETDNSRLVQRFMIDYYANKSNPVEVLLNVWEDR